MTDAPVFFASADPGGAQELSATLRYLKAEGILPAARLFTGRNGYEPIGTPLPYERVNDEGEVRALFEKTTPRLVFIATSSSDETEWLFLRESQRRGVPTAAIIDHWGNFWMRFTRRGETIFPDHIYVNDLVARDRAIEEQLPAEQVAVFGNPFLAEAAAYRPAVDKEHFFQDTLALDPNRLTIVFLSDALIETCGSEEGARHRFGYTETEIFDSLLNAFKVLADRHPEVSQSNIVIKLHPKEFAAKYQGLEKKAGQLTAGRVLLTQDAPLWDLLAYSDVILGMFSAAVLHAALLGKRPLRIEMGATENFLPVASDYFADRVVKSEKFIDALSLYLSQRPTGPAHQSNFLQFKNHLGRHFPALSRVPS